MYNIVFKISRIHFKQYLTLEKLGKHDPLSRENIRDINPEKANSGISRNGSSSLIMLHEFKKNTPTVGEKATNITDKTVVQGVPGWFIG